MIDIEIWSDFVCPFCYIGKRHLEHALAAFPRRDDVRLQWKSFELDPHGKKKPEGTIHELLARKYRQSLAWAKQATAHTSEMAATVGLKLDYDRMIPANTFNAHRLLQLAARHNLAPQAEERFMCAYFTEGRNLNDAATLTELAVAIGLDPAEVKRALESDAYMEEVRRDEQMAAGIGVNGVPFFLFDKEIPLSGAQPVEVFLATLEQATAK